MSEAWTLTVTAPADDLQLLTPEELRAAAGLEPDDTSQDATLATTGLQVAAALAGACGIAKAGYDASLAPLRGEALPTLKAETLSQTFRIWSGNANRKLLLARWPVLSIISVTTDATELVPADFEIDIPEASITRISGYSPMGWPVGRITVQYDAGYDDPVPTDLKGYASRLVSLYHQTTGAGAGDPSVRRVEVPGVITLERWVDTTTTDVLVPEDIMTGLQRDGYRRVLAW
jgi:hypothetical protein